MEEPILEVVTRIMEKGKFSKSKTSVIKLKKHIEKLFMLNEKDKSQSSARMVYSGIIDLARIGKGELAHDFARRFEEEIGYEEL